jgi:hypothetical protein
MIEFKVLKVNTAKCFNEVLSTSAVFTRILNSICSVHYPYTTIDKFKVQPKTGHGDPDWE